MRFTLFIEYIYCFICLEPLLFFLETKFPFFLGNLLIPTPSIYSEWTLSCTFKPLFKSQLIGPKISKSLKPSPLFLFLTPMKESSLVFLWWWKKAPSWEIWKLFAARIFTKQKNVICRESYLFNMQKNGERIWRARIWQHLVETRVNLCFYCYLFNSFSLYNSFFGLKQF